MQLRTNIFVLLELFQLSGYPPIQRLYKLTFIEGESPQAWETQGRVAKPTESVLTQTNIEHHLTPLYFSWNLWRIFLEIIIENIKKNSRQNSLSCKIQNRLTNPKAQPTQLSTKFGHQPYHGLDSCLMPIEWSVVQVSPASTALVSPAIGYPDIRLSGYPDIRISG